VFGNLLTNAIKYTPRGGSVHVQLAGVGPQAVVRVVDTGIGIAKDMLSSVFELFSQAETGLDRAQGGMGLGLTLVRSLVRQHGGSIEAFSQGEGQGSEFRVCLPLLARDSVTTAPQPASEHEPIGARRIVIVEDNDDVREMQEEMLQLEGHEVRTAATGPDGVSTILEFMPDAAFIDLGLPGCDGFEVARRVRAASPTILLIAVSGYGQPVDRKRAHAAGFDGHLTKPVGLEDFVSSMARLREPTTPAAPTHG
jgi:CheY-like chemotaxis protein